MSRKVALLVLGALSFIAGVSCPGAKAAPRPLSKSELLALVAGQAVPEDILGEIRLFGLNFRPDAAYVALLKTAGADAKVLAALPSAKFVTSKEADRVSDAEFLRQLSNAGKFIHAGQLDQAASELDASLTEDAKKPAAGYVMGEILIKQDRVPDALAVYSEVLQQDPDFPEVHVRLSYAYLETNEPEEGLRQSKATLERNPDNPVGHLNAGIAYQQLGKMDAAKSEMQLAIRCKPDYDLAYSSLGSLLDDLRDFDGAIAQYQKALTLKPGSTITQYNLGVVYGEKGDYVSAIREYREVKRLDPHMLEARQNLGSALMHQDPAAAIAEFRELAAMAPEWPFCHECLGTGLARLGRFSEAEKEYELAVTSDPASPEPLVALGDFKESQKDYDAALANYRKAEQLVPSYAPAHASAGRVLLEKKDFSGAIAELKQAGDLDPTGWANNDFLGQALEFSGNGAAAIAAYRQAVTLAPKQQLGPRLHLALAFEKQGNWIAALDNYHQAAVDEPPLKIGTVVEYFDAQNKYKNAQQRFQQHLSELRASGKASEADSLEAQLREHESAPNIDEAFHDAIQASKQAIQEKRFDDAETAAKKAIAMAEKIQPRDARLPEAVGQLASVYAWRLDYASAEEIFKRQLALMEGLYGTDSPELSQTLHNLAMIAMRQKDLATSEAYLSRSVDLNEKAYGDNSPGTTEALRDLASFYIRQKEYDKSEVLLLRVVKIYENMHNPEDGGYTIPLSTLCYVYDQWGKPDKSADCHARVVSLVEKQFGATSPYLVQDLNAEAQALRQLGRNDEATAIEQRTQAIQASAQANPN